MLSPLWDHVGLFLDVLGVLARLGMSWDGLRAVFGQSWGGLGGALAVSWAPAASRTPFQTPLGLPRIVLPTLPGAKLGPKARPSGGLGFILGILGLSWVRLEPS